MTELPKVATGDSELVSVLNKLRTALRERTPVAGYGIDVSEKGERGFIIKLARQSPQTVTSEDSTIMAGQLGMVDRGEFHSSVNYNAQDVVTVPNGTNSGLYVATEAMNAGASEPGVSGFWRKIGEVYVPAIFV